jgi:acetolactate synthase-1/2/3 large subunit
MNVAEYIARFIEKKNISHVFGYQGGAILKLVEEMVATGSISFVQNYHEQASAFAADAFARVTGNVGVAIATSGPGATNMITGIVNAQMDSIPVLFITGQDYLANVSAGNGARQNGFQDLDIVSMVRPVTKYAAMVRDPKRIRYELEQAYFHAKNGRPGAVLLDIPIDIQFMEVEEGTLEGFNPVQTTENYNPDLTRIVAELKSSKKPVILVGGGVRLSNAISETTEFANKSRIPVITTLNGLDCMPGNMGFAGLHGNTAANLAAMHADLLIVLGARLGNHHVGKNAEKYTRAKVIHVDIDDSELGRIYPNEIKIKSDLKKFLSLLNEILQDQKLPDYSVWKNKISAWHDKYHGNVLINDKGLDPVRVIETMLPEFSSEAIFTNDVGQSQMWVAQAFRVKRGQRLLNSVGLGSMGFSLPAAIGAKIACPSRQVIAFMGDGGLQMNIQELMLVGMRKMAIKCIVFNNGTLGKIREIQKRHYKESYHGTNPLDYQCVNLKLLAEAYSIGYKKITNLEDIKTMENILGDPYPYLIEVPLDIDSKLTNRYDETSCFEAEAENA